MKLPESETPLTHTTHLLQTLLASTPKTHHFKSKWSSISTKLTSLSSHLSSLSSSSPTNSLSLDLLRSLSLTLSSALSLLPPCLSPHPLPNGKLHTQNDVDSILTRLDRHLHDLHVLLNSGLLLHNDAVPLPPFPSPSSVRHESKNLITRLQIGSTESKSSAMDSLLTLLHENDKNIIIAVAQGIVPVLVRLLDCSSSFDLKDKTVNAIARVSSVESSKPALIAEGLVLLNNLLRVVESGSGLAREKACIALKALTQSKENARAIGSRGGVSSLLAICEAGTPSSQAAAAGVLRDLSLFEEVKECFTEESNYGVRILLKLFASGTSLAQENAIGCLCNLVVDDFQLKLLVAREGGIESLKSYWDSVESAKSVEVAVELVRHLATMNPICEILVDNGFLNRVVSVLSCGVLGVRISAAKAIHELGYNTKTRKELGELGCIAPLVRMMEGKVREERESAAKALSNLMAFAGNRSVFRKEERGIVVAVQLLNPSTRDLDKKYPVSLLASLVHSKRCRKQMIAAGASGFLQKLVEMDVEGARKLLENLGKGKIWGVFARP